MLADQLCNQLKVHRWVVAFLLIVVSMSATGCTAVIQPINSLPAHRVPRQFLAQPRANKVPIDFSRLRIIPPEKYLLEAGDVLGVYVEGVLGSLNEAPPVQLAQQGSDLPPAIGYPVAIREDGTISLPLLQPIPVRGLTLEQVERIIFDHYTGEAPGGRSILRREEARIIVTLLQKHTYRVIVIRQDNAATSQNRAGDQAIRASQSRTDLSSRGFVLDLPAGQNDVLSALAQTGGLPGVNSKPEVKVLRGNEVRWRDRERQVQAWIDQYGGNKDPCFIPPPIPEDTSALKIPLRTPPGVIPNIRQEDITLYDGDIVMVESRESEVYYTGGLLPGGERQLPRDFDLDVLGAVAISGGSVGAPTGLGRGALTGAQAVPPTQLIVLRKTPGGGQIAISVDLIRAVNDPRSRLLVQPGDTLILRYKPEEEIVNFGLTTFFTYGIRELFRN